jgi:hypothetical protein
MTSGGPQQGWPGQPDGSWPGQGAQPGYGQPGYGQSGAIPPGQSGQPGQPAWQQPGQPAQPTWQQQPGQAPATGPQHGWAPQGPAQPTWQQPGWPPSGPADQGYPQGAPGQGYGPGVAPGQQPGFGMTPPPGAPGQGPAGKRKSHTPVIATVIAVVVALIAAGTVYLLARNGSDTAGQATPKDAVVNLLNSVTDEDPIGIADQLDPTEAHLFTDMTGDVLTQLKRLGIVNQDVQADSVSGVSITTKDLTYADSPIVINDHLQIVELTGGTITLTTGGATNPYTNKITDAFPELKQVTTANTHTIDIAKEVADLGHPFRIATVDRDGKWYPSLFYTIADNWAYQTQGAHYQLNPIGDDGGATPEKAMDKFIKAISSEDQKALISVLSPDEMGVLHDYGNLMIDADSGLADTGLGDAELENVTWAVSDVTGGKKVSVKTITVKTEQGDFSIERDPAAGSLKVSMPGTGTINMSADNIDAWLQQTMGDAASQLDPQAKEIIKREFSKVIGLGVVMVQGADGKWYVSPLRTFSDVLTSLLSGLEAGDIDYFLKMAGK